MLDYDLIASEYEAGASLNELSAQHGIARSALWRRLNKRGILRTRTEGVHNALSRGKMRVPKPHGPLSEETKAKLSKAHLERWEGKAVGFTIKPNGYRAHTRGPDRGRSEHTTIMEERLGRRLKADEVVHHVDGDRANNDPDNLALMTRRGHSRLHRLEKIALGKAAADAEPA